MELKEFIIGTLKDITYAVSLSRGRRATDQCRPYAYRLSDVSFSGAGDIQNLHN